MEGISPISPGLLPTNRLKAPYLAEDLHEADDVSFYDFPRFKGVASTDEAILRKHFPTTLSLASFMQSWLFFRLLSAFLRHPVRHTDFVTDGFINLGQVAVDAHFRQWKDELWKASYVKKLKAKRDTEAVIRHALAKSEIFEDIFEQRDIDFDHVALSVKLLAGLLLAVLDDTFSKTSGAWTPWARNAFKRAHRTLRQFTFPYANYRPDFADDYINAMSNGDLIKTLYGHQVMPSPLPPGDFNGGRATSLLLSRFEANGWCPFRARQLCQTFDHLTLNNMCGLIKHPSVIEDHGRCLEMKRCCAHDVVGIEQNNTYPFRHDSSECDGSCSFIKIPYEELADIILSGEKPIISVSVEGPLDLEVVRCTPYTTYTAISHVWSDGRGNPTENALPRCQVIWLRERIRQTYHAKYNPFYDDATLGSIWRSELKFGLMTTLRPGRPCASLDKKRIFFWMDTLCIPVRPESDTSEETRKLRFRAIKQITPIFVGAFNSLVLDRVLEDTVTSSPALLSGDEFAAYVLGCTWMERGWTLQEGCLSHSCVMQLMGKPYEMTMSLRNLLPTIESDDSPLRRASVNIQRANVFHLRRGLLEYKRQIILDPWFPRAKRLFKMLQTPLFVWTWNSLINRSTTRPSDGVLIFASVLDFDVYQLRLVPQKERLMSVIQGCDELPLSLLYNRGPRVCIEGHPELSWIPEDVRGDSLVIGPVLRKLRFRRANGPLVYSIERGNRDRDSLLALVADLGQYIPNETRTLRMTVPASQSASSDVKEYIVDIERTSLLPNSTESLVVIDLTCGTNAHRGYVGRGACFSIISHSQTQMTVRYDAPLVAYTIKQWTLKAGDLPVPTTSFLMKHVARQKVIMSYDASLWRGQLVRRPLYTMYPFWAQALGVFAFFVVLIPIVIAVSFVIEKLRDVGIFPRGPFPIAHLCLLFSFPFLTAFILAPIRRRLSMFGYISWLKTFDEPSEAPSTCRRSALWAQYLAMSLRRLRRGFLWALFKVGINLSRQRHFMRDDELPGGIYLV